ncbi:NCS1 nucleoside transporter family [Trametes meyenii]|nr:NCS1 nucleoside transporter family [Trametes meyenii]
MSGLLKRLEIKHKDEFEGEVTAWINRDIVPLPPSRRTWGAWSFVGYWLLTGFTIGGWTTASSLLGIGLNVWQAMVSVIIGQLLVALAVVANGYVGAEWHVGFPVYNRFVFGVYGSFFPLLMRILLSIVWYGVQLVFGGKSVKVVIASIWPSFYTLHNTLPESAGIELNDLIGILVFAAISMPLILVPPEHYRKPFFYGSVIITATMFAMFVWALAKQHGGGPLLSHPNQLSGAAPLAGGAPLGWAMAYGVSSTIGSICAGILNQSDYTRFATRPRAQIASQLAVVPVGSILVAFFGVVVTSCAAGFFPEEPLLWAPYDLLRAVQVRGGPGARAACFFAGCAFVMSQCGVNVPGNAIAGGIDFSGLLPKYINIRRGGFLTAVIGIAICPWKLLTGSSVFLTVLSSFSVFLGPLTIASPLPRRRGGAKCDSEADRRGHANHQGVMIADYLVVRKRALRLSHLYKPDRDSIYYFTHGVNFRALAAWVLGVWPLMPGFISSVSPRPLPLAQGWVHVYDLAWPLGFVLSAGVHVALSAAFPPVALGEVDEEDVFGTFADEGAGRARRVAPGLGLGLGLPGRESESGRESVEDSKSVGSEDEGRGGVSDTVVRRV